MVRSLPAPFLSATLIGGKKMFNRMVRMLIMGLV